MARDLRLRAPRVTEADKARHDAAAARLIAVTYVVIAGPPGSPKTMTLLEDPERYRKGPPR